MSVAELYLAPEIEAFHWPCLLANVQSKEKFFAFSILGAEAESAGGVAVEIETVVVLGAEAEIVTGGGIETEIETETGTGIGTGIGGIDIGTGVEAEKGKCVFAVCCVGGGGDWSNTISDISVKQAQCISLYIL